MPLDYARLMALPAWETEHRYTSRDTMLYALGVGAGAVLDAQPHELAFVYETGLIALPTLAAVIAYTGFWQQDPQYGLTWRKLLHGEQSIILHRPMPAEGHLLGTTRITEIYDKGAEKGALLEQVRHMRDAASGEAVATVRSVSFLRADGGFGGNGAIAPAPHPIPDRPADDVVDLPTRPEQAMLYRLSGDYNPLHIDPDVAASAGFPKPILHGLATYAVAGRALIAALCPDRPDALRRIDTRFSAPVFPGETIRTSIWLEANGEASFRAEVIERGVRVLDNGYATYV